MYEADTDRPSTIEGRVYNIMLFPPAAVNIAALPAVVVFSGALKPSILTSKLSKISPAAVASKAETAVLPPFPENLNVPSASEEIVTE